MFQIHRKRKHRASDRNSSISGSHLSGFGHPVGQPGPGREHSQGKEPAAQQRLRGLADAQRNSAADQTETRYRVSTRFAIDDLFRDVPFEDNSFKTICIKTINSL